MFKPCNKCKNGYIDKSQGKIYKKVPCDCLLIYHEIVNLKYQLKNLGYSFYEDDFIFWHPLKKETPTYSLYQGTKSVTTIKKLSKIDWDKNPFIVYFYGVHGTQKTVIGQWLGKVATHSGYPTYYITMKELITAITPTFEVEALKKNLEVITKLNNVRNIIIDQSFEKDVLKVWENQLAPLYSFIKNSQEKNNQNLIFISNVEIENIKNEGYNISIQKYIKDRAIVFEFKDIFDKLCLKNIMRDDD